MSTILRQLPFLQEADEITVGTERLRIRPYQIVAWVSITPRRVVAPPADAPRIPVILDTGHNHHFSIQAQQLIEWARLSPSLLQRRGTITVEGDEIPLYAAAVWIHANQAGFRDRFADRPPHRLELREGIAVFPRDVPWPRLPLLGLRALVYNKLHFTMDPERCVVNLRTPDWRTAMIRLLQKS